jgi:hypothetical protein
MAINPLIEPAIKTLLPIGQTLRCHFSTGAVDNYPFPVDKTQKCNVSLGPFPLCIKIRHGT